MPRQTHKHLTFENAINLNVPFSQRRKNIERAHRSAESSRSFIREKCPRCRELYPLGTLDSRWGLCSLCRAELIDLSRHSPADREERQRWTPGAKY